MLDKVYDHVVKLDKAKLVLCFSIATALVYLFIKLQEETIQKSVVTTVNGYTQNQPIDMCVQGVDVTHQMFPPRFGAEVRYQPCQRNL